MDPFALAETSGGFEDLMAKLAGGLVIALFIAIFIERSLAFFFDMAAFKAVDDFVDKGGIEVDLKRLVTLGFCGWIAFYYPIDLFGYMMSKDPSAMGKILTMGMLAGGSKGIISFAQTFKKSAQELK